MVDKTISELDAADPLTGSEKLPAVQGSDTVRTTVNQVASYASQIPVVELVDDHDLAVIDLYQRFRGAGSIIIPDDDSAFPIGSWVEFEVIDDESININHEPEEIDLITATGLEVSTATGLGSSQSGRLQKVAAATWYLTDLSYSSGVNSLMQDQIDQAIADNDLSITIVIGNGTDNITAGAKGRAPIKIGRTITGYTMVADASGSAVVDIKTSTYAGFPTTASIAGTEKPTLAAAQKSQDLALTTWTPDIDGDTILEAVVDSASGVKQITILLHAEPVS